jgi:hypothetical protein
MISLNRINQLVFVLELQCIFFVAGTELVNVIYELQRVMDLINYNVHPAFFKFHSPPKRSLDKLNENYVSNLTSQI